MAVGSAEPYANHLSDNHASTSPLKFYGPHALPDTQPTVSKHWRQTCHSEPTVQSTKLRNRIHFKPTTQSQINNCIHLPIAKCTSVFSCIVIEMKDGPYRLLFAISLCQYFSKAGYTSWQRSSGFKDQRSSRVRGFRKPFTNMLQHTNKYINYTSSKTATTKYKSQWHN